MAIFLHWQNKSRPPRDGVAEEPGPHEAAWSGDALSPADPQQLDYYRTVLEDQDLAALWYLSHEEKCEYKIVLNALLDMDDRQPEVAELWEVDRRQRTELYCLQTESGPGLPTAVGG